MAISKNKPYQIQEEGLTPFDLSEQPNSGNENENENDPQITSGEYLALCQKSIELVVPQKYTLKEIQDAIQTAKNFNNVDFSDLLALKNVADCRLVLKNYRLAIEKKQDEFLEIGKIFINGIKTTAKNLIVPIESLETKLQKIESDAKAYKAEQERLEEQKKVDLANCSVHFLRSKYGANYNGVSVTLGNALVTFQDLKNLSEHEFQVVENTFKFQFQEIEKQKELERKKQEEDNRMRLEFEALKAENERLKALLNPIPEVHTPTENPATVEKIEPIFEKPATVENHALVDKPQNRNLGLTQVLANEMQKQIENSIFGESNQQTAQPQTLKPSDQFIADFNAKNGDKPNAPHFINGFRKGLEFAKKEALAILENTQTYNTRALVKSSISDI